MKKLKRRIIVVFFVSLFVSISMVVGIPMIPIGFANDIVWMGIVGIVLTAHGFYGVTFYWIWFGGLISCKRLITAINTHYLYTVTELDAHLSKNSADVQKNIRKCINKGWLEGVLFDGETIFVNTNKPLDIQPEFVTCAYCDGVFPAEKGMLRCPNCGGPLPIKDKEKIA